MSVSSVTSAALEDAARTSCARASRSAGKSRMALAPLSTSRRRSCSCSWALSDWPGYKNRSSTFRSAAACSMPWRAVAQAEPSASRAMTDISKSSGRRWICTG